MRSSTPAPGCDSIEHMDAWGRYWLVLGALLFVGGCTLNVGSKRELPDPSEQVGSTSQALTTVDSAVLNSCTTTSVKGLSVQIVDEMNCLIPNALAPVPNLPNLTKSAATFAYLQPPARDGFVASLNSRPSTSMTVNSMLRTVAQQYLLYRWYQLGRCGIGLAATPGTSNHESGLAFDTSQYSTWRTTLEANGFHWFGSADVVHFDYTGAGIVNLSGKDVLAFQKLWNLNHPGNTITEDGIYGPQTAASLKASPAAGFSTAPSCMPHVVDGGADSSGVDGGAGFSGVDGGAGFSGAGGAGFGGASGTAGLGGGLPTDDGGPIQQSRTLGNNNAGCSCRLPARSSHELGSRLLVVLGLTAGFVERRRRAKRPRRARCLGP